LKNLTLILISFALMYNTAHAQTPNIEEVKWQDGPSVGNLSSIATIQVPGGYVFADANDTRILMEEMKNPISGIEMGFIAPEDLDWFVVFEFDDDGYVPDDDKDSLDADAMLESIKKGTEAGNKERLQRGWPTMTIVGWEQKPRYNTATNNLEWAVKARGEGGLIINYNTRILGRSGVMRLTLVADPNTLAPTLSKFKDLLAGYVFNQGQKYAEYKQGDKMAKYGLAALVVGGASAVAAKTGLFKWLWKGILVGGIALIAFLKSLFSRKKD